MRVRPPDGNLRAAPLPELQLPHSRHLRMGRGAPFFRMCEEQGTANAVTIVESMEWPDTARGSLRARHRLHPQTGRQHHLRVHMAALGAPINNDTLYPELDATALHSAGLAGD